MAKQKARQVFCLGVEGWLFTVLTKTVGKAGSKVGVLFKGRWLAILVLTEPVGKAEGKAGVLVRGGGLAVYLLSLLAKQKARQVFWSGVDGWDSAGDPPPMFYNK